MKVVHVIPHIDREASGPSYSVPRLCQSLAGCGNEVELMCLGARAQIEGVALTVHPQWSVLPRFAISTSLTSMLRHQAQMVDVVHNNSLWSMVNVAAGCVVPGKRAKLVTSPRGTLSLWALGRSRMIKRMLWPLQRRVLARADLLHATSEVEYEEIRAQGFAAPIALIPNGVDLPELAAPIFSGSLERGDKTLLFLSRIHPTKGLDRLLYAWAKLQDHHRNWRLVIAGPGEAAHVRQIEDLAAYLQLERVEFPGPLYGLVKTRAYLSADLFVLPTHSENFGMVVAEALAHGCPALVSRGAPWSGLEVFDSGWWVDNHPEALAAALDSAMKMPTAKRAAMGERGRAWMQRDYGWDAVGQKMDAAYRWVLDGGLPPPEIRLD